KQFDFENIFLIKGGQNRKQKVTPINRNELPYPSLNEVNFLAFAEATNEYHIELYGFIETIGEKENYKYGKPTRNYKRKLNGNIKNFQYTLTEYIRHQIHHPENKLNILFTDDEI